jgi:hypothetical protein
MKTEIQNIYIAILKIKVSVNKMEKQIQFHFIWPDTKNYGGRITLGIK